MKLQDIIRVDLSYTDCWTDMELAKNRVVCF